MSSSVWKYQSNVECLSETVQGGGWLLDSFLVLIFLISWYKLNFMFCPSLYLLIYPVCAVNACNNALQPEPTVEVVPADDGCHYNFDKQQVSMEIVKVEKNKEDKES